MTSWREARFAAVDIETTGLDPTVDEILSVAVVPIDGGRIQAGGSLYRTLRAERAPSRETILVHGIRPVDVASAEQPASALDAVVEAIGDRVLVVHVQWVERTFLTPVFQARGRPWPARVVDTDVLVRRVMRLEGEPAPAGHVRLSAVAERFGLPVHRPHHAEGDALTTAQAFLALAARLSGERDATVQELTRDRPESWWERAFGPATARVPRA